MKQLLLEEAQSLYSGIGAADASASSGRADVSPRVGTLDHVLRTLPLDPGARGRACERLFKWYLEHSPFYTAS